MEEHVGGARGRRPRGRVVDRVPAERRQDLLGLEPLAQILRGRRAEQEGRVGDQRAVARRHPAQLREPRKLAGAQVARVRRSRVDERRDQAGDAAPAPPRRRGARARPPRRTSRTRAGWRARSSSRRSEEPSGPRFSAGPAGSTVIPRSTRLEVPPDGLAQHAEDVRPRRSVEPRRELLGHRAAADDLAALQDDRLEARRSRGSRRRPGRCGRRRRSRHPRSWIPRRS